MTKVEFPFYPNEKTGVFIDGAYLYSVSRNLEFDIDYNRLLKWISKRGQLVRASYYTAIAEDQEYSSIRPLVDWLNYNGFKVVTKNIKEEGTGNRRKKGDINVELTADAVALASKVDHILLFAGDSDFTHLVKVLQNEGVRVTLFGTIATSNTVTSDELRRHADHFIEMELFIDEICRDSNSEAADLDPPLPDFIDA